MAEPSILERESERAALDGAVTGAAEGRGTVVVAEGPAGIGKTTLLGGVRDAAGAVDATVLWARASELDRGFAYGVVHQLLEPLLAAADEARRERLFAGAASRCRVLFESADAPPGDVEYAVLSGLYWLLANLGDDGPVVLVVDDLHWADVPSARFLEFTGRRIEDLPLALLATARPNEPGAPQQLIDELMAGPAAVRIGPAPLGADSVHELVARALGAEPDPAFAEAALTATGGNPLLVATLGEEAGSLGLRGAAGEAERLDALVAKGVAPAVTRRLRTLGPDAVAVAEALAVIGPRSTHEDVAELTSLAPERVSAAVGQLDKAGVLEPRSHVFTHPLVRAAVGESIAPGTRQQLHRAAAEGLRARGAKPAEVAVHRLESEPAGDPAAVADLLAAAGDATAEGATESAVQLLRRALDEPPPAPERASILLQLGELEVRAQLPQGVDRLRAALEAGLEGDDAVRARAAMGTFLVHTDPVAAIDEVEAAHADAEDPALRMRLEAFTVESLIFPDAFAARRDAHLAAGLVDPRPSPVMLAHLALAQVTAGAPTGDVAGLCARAVEGGRLMAEIGPASSTWNLLVHAHRFNEDADRSGGLLAEADRIVRRQGLRSAGFFVEQAWAYWHRDFGSVATGASRAAAGLDLIREAGFELTVPALAAALAENLMELSRLDEAAEVVDLDLPDIARDSFMEPFALTARGQLRALMHRDEEAEEDLRRAIVLGDARGWRAPSVTRGRLRLTELLARRGATDEALALAEHDVEVARSAGTAGALGNALRARASAEDDAAAERTLEAAVEALDATPLQRDLGWALHDLGARIRRTGRRQDAREPLRRALDLGARTEATRLAEAAREELAATGAQARRDLLSGAESLTPSERRVADLAAEGLTNREIAEGLWLSAKTVEVHLTRTYGKLGIRSRRSLAGALHGHQA